MSSLKSPTLYRELECPPAQNLQQRLMNPQFPVCGVHSPSEHVYSWEADSIFRSLRNSNENNNRTFSWSENNVQNSRSWNSLGLPQIEGYARGTEFISRIAVYEQPKPSSR